MADESSADDLRAAPLAFDPLATFASARSKAARFAADPVAQTLAGHREGDLYRWTWTFGGRDGASVDVQAGPGGTKVVWHGTRQYFVDPGSFDPQAVHVKPQDVPALLGSHGPTPLVEAMTLQSNRTTEGRPAWIVSLADGTTRVVDAATGNIVR